MAQQFETTKRKAGIIFDGYVWRQGKVISDGKVQVWQCVTKKCTGYAHSPIGTQDLVVKTEHNHRRSATSIELRFVINFLKSITLKIIIFGGANVGAQMSDYQGVGLKRKGTGT